MRFISVKHLAQLALVCAMLITVGVYAVTPRFEVHDPLLKSVFLSPETDEGQVIVDHFALTISGKDLLGNPNETSFNVKPSSRVVSSTGEVLYKNVLPQLQILAPNTDTVVKYRAVSKLGVEGPERDGVVVYVPIVPPTPTATPEPEPTATQTPVPVPPGYDLKGVETTKLGPLNAREAVQPQKQQKRRR